MTPLASAANAQREYGLTLLDRGSLHGLDAAILAVPHEAYLSDVDELLTSVGSPGVVIDVKSALAGHSMPQGVRYWSL